MRADFLAYDERTKDARALLDGVLKEDPNNVIAYEAMGYLAFREGKLDEAGKWYEKAVKLDSHSFLAQYYFRRHCDAKISFAGPECSNRGQLALLHQT